MEVFLDRQVIYGNNTVRKTEKGKKLKTAEFLSTAR